MLDVNALQNSSLYIVGMSKRSNNRGLKLEIYRLQSLLMI